MAPLRNWLAAQRVTGVQASSGAILALVHLPLCWCLVRSCGYLGAAIATSVGNLLRMLWVIFQSLGAGELRLGGAPRWLVSCRADLRHLPTAWASSTEDLPRTETFGEFLARTFKVGSHRTAACGFWGPSALMMRLTLPCFPSACHAQFFAAIQSAHKKPNQLMLGPAGST